jgi:hypothetical protein
MGSEVLLGFVGRKSRGAAAEGARKGRRKSGGQKGEKQEEEGAEEGSEKNELDEIIIIISSQEIGARHW